MSGRAVVPALAYSANARPATYGRSVEGITPEAASRGGAVQVFSPTPGSTCGGYKDDGTPCGARPMKGEYLCAGHMRKEGRL